jgi:hypothetical protein
MFISIGMEMLNKEWQEIMINYQYKKGQHTLYATVNARKLF